MKVLFFTRDYTPHDYRFLKAIIDNGIAPYYLPLEKRFHYELRELPEGVHKVEWNWGKEPYQIEYAEKVIEDLKDIAAQISPDVIHTGPLTDTSFLAAKANLHPHIAMSWGFDLLREITQSKMLQENAEFALQHADWFLGDCYVELDTAEKMGMNRNHATIFPWGIDPAAFTKGSSHFRQSLPGEKDLFLILSLRTMAPNYRVDTVVEAFLRAVKERPQMRLVLLSDGSEEQMLRELAAKDSDGDKIFWLGRRKNEELIDFYRCADLYVSASIVDGSSVSLLEAMSCEVPVLMSDIPGNREWVESGKTGTIFPVGDVEALERHLIHAVDQPDELRVMAKAARALICEKADWNKNKFGIRKAYQGAIDLCVQ